MDKYEELYGKAAVITLTSGVRFIARYCGYDVQDDCNDNPVYYYYEFQALETDDPCHYICFDIIYVTSIEKYEEGMKFTEPEERVPRLEDDLRKEGFILVESPL